MSFLKSAFTFKKTKPRKHVSRTPLQLPADELLRELGPRCDVIDVRVADQKIVFDTQYGDWDTAGAETLGGTVSSGSAQRIRKEVEVLQEENNMLKLKVEVLLNLVAESIAEISTGQR